MKIRTYERGIEEETLGCGTGAAAASLAARRTHRIGGRKEVRVDCKGGSLTVELKAHGEDVAEVLLSGPAETDFEGETVEA